MPPPDALNVNCSGDDAELRHVGIAVRSGFSSL
jgi:hypothetical protein